MAPPSGLAAPQPRLSIVLPCLNGSGFIARSLCSLSAWLTERCSTLGPAEIVVVDDGSSDETLATAATCGVSFRSVRHERNRGKGAAVRSGMLAATGEYRIFIDADLPFELGILERMVHYLDFKEFDVVIGTRARRGASYAIARPASRQLASFVFAEIVGRMVVTGVRDTQCGVKGFRAAAAEYLFREARVDRFAFDVELLYLAFKNGFEVKVVPVQVVSGERSTIQVRRDGIPMLWDVVRLPFRFHSGGYRLQLEAEGARGSEDSRRAR